MGGMSALIKLPFIIALLSLVSCQSEAPELSSLLDYQARMKRLLEVDDEFNSRTNSKKEQGEALLIGVDYPEPRQLKRPVNNISIGWRDFFASIDCPSLQALIGQRNTPAGKHPDDATALLYELQLKRLWLHCSIKMKQLPDQLRSPLENKLKQFDREVWNRTWAGNYWQKLFSNNRNRQAFNKAAVSKVVLAIRQIRQAVQAKPDQTINHADIYSAFKIIEKNQGALGQLIFLLTEHQQTMERINHWLEQKMTSICPQKITTTQSKYLVGVLQKFYFTSVQRQQSELTESFQQVRQELLQWSMFFPKKPTSNKTTFQQWHRWQQWSLGERGFKKLDLKKTDSIKPDTLKIDSIKRAPKNTVQDNNKGLASRLVSTVKQHVTIWQTFGKQCQLTIRPTSR